MKDDRFRGLLATLVGGDLLGEGWAEMVLNRRSGSESRWELRPTDLDLRDSHLFRNAAEVQGASANHEIKLTNELKKMVFDRVRDSNQVALTWAPMGLDGYF